MSVDKLFPFYIITKMFYFFYCGFRGTIVWNYETKSLKILIQNPKSLKNDVQLKQKNYLIESTIVENLGQKVYSPKPWTKSKMKFFVCVALGCLLPKPSIYHLHKFDIILNKKHEDPLPPFSPQNFKSFSSIPHLSPVDNLDA